MASVGDRLASIEATFKEHGKKLDRIEAAIYGNGKAGLITELKLLQQSVNEHHQSVDELRNRSRGDWKWVVTTCIAIAAVIATFLK